MILPNYKIENQIIQYEPIRGFPYLLDFLKQYGHLEDRIVGEIIAGRSILQIGIGTIGFDVIGDSVVIGPEWKQLFVLDAYRGRGLGKRLTELAIEYAAEISRQEGKELKTAETLTKPDNLAAKIILEQLGFQINERTSISNEVVHYVKQL